jgi:WD40 repeat protein
MTTNIVSTLTIKISERSSSYYIAASGLSADVKSLPFTWTPAEEDLEIIDLLHSEPQMVSEEQLIALGQTLYKSVFTPEILLVYDQSNRKLRSGNGIRIRLIVESKNLSHIPWEVMHNGQDFISLYSDYPLVRGMRESFHVRQSAVSGPIRILYVWSEPKDLPPLNLSNPAEEIKKMVGQNRRIKFDILPNATVISLRKALLSQYHIVCFAGHGDEKHIYLETVMGHDKLSAKELARELEGRPVQLVFLAACKTAGVSTEGLSNFANTLANETQIPAIAAMQYEISDDQANLLAARYFETIANFRPLDVALSESRKALLRERKVLRDVFAPVIYLQSKTSNLFQRARNWLAISFSIIAVVAIVIAAIFGKQFQSSLIDVGLANSTAKAEATRAEAEAITRATAQALAEEEGIARATAQVEAEEKKVVARARELALMSAAERNEHLDLSLLLGIEAFNTFDNTQTQGTLLDNLQANSHLVRYINYSDPLYSILITAVAFSPDGTILAAATSTGKIILRDIKTNQIISQLPSEPLNSFISLAFNPDGNILAAGEIDGPIYIWNINTFQLIGKLNNHAKRITGLSFSPDGKTLISGSFDNSIIFWNVEELKLIKRIATQKFVRGIALSPDGKILASIISTDIVLWDTSNYSQIGEPLEGNTSASSIAFSSKNILAVGGDVIVLWNIPLLFSYRSVPNMTLTEQMRERVIKKLTGHTDMVVNIAFSPNGHTLISGTIDGRITIWDGFWDPNPVSLSLPIHTSMIESLSFSSDGRTFASSSSSSGTILLWDIESYSPTSLKISDFANIGELSDIHVKSDQSFVIYQDDEYGLIKFLDFTTDQLVYKETEKNSNTYYSSLTINPNSKSFASGDLEGKITVWDIDSMRSINQIDTGYNNEIISLVFSPNGKILASGDTETNVLLWDVSTGKMIEQLPTSNLGIAKIVFSLPHLTQTRQACRHCRLWRVCAALPSAREGSRARMDGQDQRTAHQRESRARAG